MGALAVAKSDFYNTGKPAQFFMNNPSDLGRTQFRRVRLALPTDTGSAAAVEHFVFPMNAGSVVRQIDQLTVTVGTGGTVACSTKIGFKSRNTTLMASDDDAYLANTSVSTAGTYLRGTGFDLPAAAPCDYDITATTAAAYVASTTGYVLDYFITYDA